MVMSMLKMEIDMTITCFYKFIISEIFPNIF